MLSHPGNRFRWYFQQNKNKSIEQKWQQLLSLDWKGTDLQTFITTHIPQAEERLDQVFSSEEPKVSD